MFTKPILINLNLLWQASLFDYNRDGQPFQPGGPNLQYFVPLKSGSNQGGLSRNGKH